MRPTTVFDSSRSLDISITKLRIEAEVKVIGIVAKVIQKDHSKHNENYSSKTKLVYSNLLGNIPFCTLIFFLGKGADFLRNRYNSPL